MEPIAQPAAAEPADAAEAAAWAEVEARWGEPAAHQAYLARCHDLDGLAVAGRRYRDALQARPGDTVAVAMKGEVLKRATVVGLASLPRTPRPAPGSGRARRVVLVVLACAMAAALAWVVVKALAVTS